MVVIAGCGASKTGAASTTAADVASTEAPAAEENAAPAETPAEAVSQEGVPSEKLVCRVKASNGAVAEVYLDWDGSHAVGALRKVSPSGMVDVTRLRAEKYQGTIVGDATTETDLATHAVMMKAQDGKQYVRVQGDSTWRICE